MKYITTIIQKIVNRQQTPQHLGRWKLTQCSKQINNKIDLSNEDHCGPCGQYALEKRKSMDVVISVPIYTPIIAKK